ncbi:type II secretion system F family protein [Vibrio neonatus]|uniref:type II secretion system F family protein n=1 Tax=Vibrio neonatus TaxID=278860 RepID=UPI0021C4193E|nr:type II secretion system F family protein [Vibrio neonatus]
MMSWAFLTIAVLGLGLALYFKRKPDPRYVFLEHATQKKNKEVSAVDIKGLTKSQFLQSLTSLWNVISAALGKFPIPKIIVFITVINAAAVFVNQKWLSFPQTEICIAVTVLGLFFGIRSLVDKRRKAFDTDFPDALNILMSAVTAGESINAAFAYVSKVSDNDVGREFKDISDRMRLGEEVATIFERSCKRFPYPAFLFFVITIRANMERGGQLKSVLGKLIRVLVEARNLEKKKMAMTSEARISAKIVGAIPFLFLIFLNWVNPEDLNYVLFHPDGRWILYYLLISEGVGMFLVWWLVKSIR